MIREFQQLEREARYRRVKHRQPIYLPGDEANAVYLLREGRIKISRVMEDGRELIMAILEPGELFGELEILEDTVRGTMAEALDDVSLGILDRKIFEGFLREDPDLMLKLTRRIGLRLKKTEDRLEDLVFRAVPARLARLLLELSAGFGGSTDHGTRLHFRITHQELANLIGSTRETVSAILGDFKRKGLIRQDHRLITIRDHERFAMLQ